MGVKDQELFKTKTSQKEIERKFVISSLPEEIDFSKLEGIPILQGYLANGSGNNTVRIRQKGDIFQWTVKRKDGPNPLQRDEFECQISEHQFNTMWPATEGRRIEKTRYDIPFGNSTIELDVFSGDNQGKILAEVEFETLSEAEAFDPPDWFGPDVTADGRFGNASISKNGFPDLPLLPGAAILELI